MKDDIAIVIVDGPLASGKAGEPEYRTARSDGQSIRVRVVDADSADFGFDMTCRRIRLAIAEFARSHRLDGFSKLPMKRGSLTTPPANLNWSGVSSRARLH